MMDHQDFHPQDRFALTPAVSGAWVINKEDFWQNIKAAVSTFKLRASYAKQGNQSLQNNFAGSLRVYTGVISRPTGYLINGAQPTVVSGAPAIKCKS